MAARHVAPSCFSRLIIEMKAIAENETWDAFVCEVAGNLLKNARHVHVIRIDPAKNAAGRKIESLINRRRLATVTLGPPVGNVGLIILYDFNRVVVTSAVENKEFQI